MSNTTKLLLVIGGGLVLVLVAVFLLYPIFQGDEEPQQTNPIDQNDPSLLEPLPADTESQAGSTVVNPSNGEVVLSSEAAQRAEAERLARLFIERFNSYSNSNRAASIKSLNAFMTTSMRAYGQTVIDNFDAENSQGGVSTRVLNLTLSQFNAQQSATLTFIAQQESQASLTDPIVKEIREGRVEMIYVNGEWLVNGLFFN